jgi:four helix bundle protein
VGDHRRLRCYQAAYWLASDLQVRIREWPSFDRWTIGSQLSRSAGSIGANIAEAEGRWHGRDRARFLLIARGSLHETRHWLDMAAATQLIEPQEFDEQLDDIGKPLNGLIRETTRLAANSE